MTAPARSWRLALPSAVTLVIGVLLIVLGMQQLMWLRRNLIQDPSLARDTGAAVGIAGVFGGGLIVWGLACVVLGIGMYYGRRWAILGARLMASLMILMLAIVLVFQWNARAGLDRLMSLTLILTGIAAVWLWLIIRAQQLVRSERL